MTELWVLSRLRQEWGGQKAFVDDEEKGMQSKNADRRGIRARAMASRTRGPS